MIGNYANISALKRQPTMPSVSVKQQRLMQLAEHAPEKVSAKNRGVLRMSHKQLHDFSVGSEKGKPEYAPKKKRPRTSFPKP